MLKTVILCGGKGTRLHEETYAKPKPMVMIGDRPILWHILKYYVSFGHKDFILCLGYKSEVIKDFFRDLSWHQSDVTLTLGQHQPPIFHQSVETDAWTVTLAETGLESMTAYRLFQVKRYIGQDPYFLLTYADGVTDVDINAVIQHHKKSGKVCTLVGVHPTSRFGELTLDADTVVAFNEKPQALMHYINGGYMVCSLSMLDYLTPDPTIMLETGPLKALAQAGKLGIYRHHGFWQSMDTYSEYLALNELWAKNQAPWKR